MAKYCKGRGEGRANSMTIPPPPWRTGINNVEYKLVLVPLMIILLAVYIGYVEITPQPRTGINNVECKRKRKARREIAGYCTDPNTPSQQWHVTDHSYCERIETSM